MRSLKLGLLPLVIGLLLAVSGSATASPAHAGQPDRGTATAAGTQPRAALAAQDRRRLATQARAESWQQAVRAYPAGMPVDAMRKAEADVRAMAQRARGGERMDGAAAAAGSAQNAAPSGIFGQTWAPFGPAPMTGMFPGGTAGRASAVAVNPTNPDDVWLGAANGGVWHLPNSGAAWAATSDGESALAVGAIALAGCSATGCSTVYAGTGEDAIRRDTYRGAGLLVGQVQSNALSTVLWKRTGEVEFTPGSIYNVVLDPTTSGDGQRIYVTLSSGETASSSESTVTAPAPPQGYGIFESDNNGTSWTKLSVPGSNDARPTDLEMDPSNSNILYAGFLGRGVFKGTRNPGSGSITWCPLDPGIALPAGCAPATGLPDPAALAFDHVEIAVFKQNPSIVYATFGVCPDQTLQSCQPYVYRSTNGGAAWTTRRTGSPIDGIVTDCPYVYSRYTHALAVHPTSSDTLFLGAIQLCKSTDGGVTFSESDTTNPAVTGPSAWGNMVHLDHHAVAFYPGDPNRMYDVNDGGFDYSKDGGQTWFPANDGLQIAGFQSLAASQLTDKIVGGTQDNGTNISTGSQVWQMLYGGDGGFTIMDLQDASWMFTTVWWSTGEQAVPIRLTNGGANSKKISSGISGSDPRAFYPPLVEDPFESHKGDPSITPPYHKLYFATNRLYRSDDYGDSWVPVSPVLGGTGTIFPDIHTSNVITAIGMGQGRIYLGHYDGQIWVSGASGPCANLSCWTKVSDGKGLPGAVVTRIAVDPEPAPGNTAYVTFSGFFAGPHVFKTTTGGAAWSPANGTAPDALPDTLPVNTITIDPNQTSHLSVGTDMGVFESSDAGTHWFAYGDGLPHVPVYEITAGNVEGAVYAATHGRGVWTLKKNPGPTIYEVACKAPCLDWWWWWQALVNPDPEAVITVQVIQEDGRVCAEGRVDAQGGVMRVDAVGQMVTSRSGYFDARSGGAVFFDGRSVGGGEAAACQQASGPPARVVASYRDYSATAAAGQYQGMKDPPAAQLTLGGPAARAAEASPAADTSFELVPSLVERDGRSRPLCAARVSVPRDASPDRVLEGAEAALNANAVCAGRSLRAALASGRSEGSVEDIFPQNPSLLLSAAELTGRYLVPAVHAEPGSSTGRAFSIGRLVAPVVNQMVAMKLQLEAGPGGAAGGQVTVVENSHLGTCQVSLATRRGESGQEIARLLFDAFQAPAGDQRNPGCESSRNLRDVTLQADGSLMTAFAFEVGVQIDDEGLGFTLAPQGLDTPVTVPAPATVYLPVVVRGARK